MFSHRRCLAVLLFAAVVTTAADAQVFFAPNPYAVSGGVGFSFGRGSRLRVAGGVGFASRGILPGGCVIGPYAPFWGGPVGVTTVTTVIAPRVVVTPPPVINFGGFGPIDPDEDVPPPQARRFIPWDPEAMPRRDKPPAPPLPPVPDLPAPPIPVPPPKMEPKPDPKPAKPPRTPFDPDAPPAVPAPREPGAEADDLIAKAVEALKDGETVTAARKLRSALALRPDDTRARLLLAESLIVAGKYHEARDAVADGLSRDGDLPRAAFRSIDAYGDAIDVHGASRRLLLKTLAAHPGDPTLLFLRGFVLWFDGRRDEAGGFFAKASAAAVGPDAASIRATATAFLLSLPGEDL